MNLNCQNCEEVLSEYLCDMPSAWRKKVVSVICDGLQSDTSITCEDITECQSLTKLTAFEKTSDSVSISYVDEDGRKFVKSLNFISLLNNAFNAVDPKCVASQDDWESWGISEKINAIVAKDCECCHFGTTSTTTTTTIPAVPMNEFLLINEAGSSTPFTVIFSDEVTDAEYLSTSDLPNGNILSTTYTGSNNTSKLRVIHGTPNVPVQVTVLVNGSVFETIDEYVGSVISLGIPAHSDITVTLTNGTVTTTTTTTSTTTTTTLPPEVTSTTTTTTEGPQLSTTTTTTLAPCPQVISIGLSVAGTTSTTTTGCTCEAGFTPLPDQSGCVMEEEMPPTIVHSGYCFAPSILASQYSGQGTKIYQPGYTLNLVGTNAVLATSYWKEPIGGTTGPMNRESVWVDTDCDGNKNGLTSGERLQYTYPVTLSSPKTLYIGIGGDNTFRVDLNGVTLVSVDTTLSGSAGGLGASANFNYWHLFPVDFPAGTTYVTFSGVGDGSTNDSFAAVIYDMNEAGLIVANQDDDAGIIFKTSDLRNSTLDIATCPAGWFLDTSGGTGAYVCKRIIELNCGETTTTTTTVT